MIEDWIGRVVRHALTAEPPPGRSDARCVACGGHPTDGYGLPVYEDVVSNDWPGEWGGMPACKPCHDLHAAGRLWTYDRPQARSCEDSL